MKFLSAILLIIFVTSILALSLLSAALPMISNVYYQYGAERAGVINTSLGLNAIDFLNDRAQLNSTAFTEKEKSHMADVKEFVLDLRWAWIQAFTIAAVSLAGIYAKSKKLAGKAIRYSAIAIIVTCVLFLIGNVFFSSTFDAFHRLFFKPGSYIFGEGEILPKLFPISFFLDSFAIIVASCFAAAVLALVTMKLIKERKK
ncbi:MAG: DUF1461 domain-containing protein [Candidatus Woesearchaeota archaeon]